MSNNTKLIFVYNANSGMLNAVFDSMHKIISPNTYECALCKITYGTFTELPEWKEFKRNFPGEMVFYHIDEYEKLYEPAAEYPIVLSDEDEDPYIILPTDRLNNMRDLEELIQFLRDWAHIERLQMA